ncbi:hypothetical protein EV356DRAFT_530059 [Viridothelium virens]|uniref:Uncharacterized protein n=1 Tax=Viridothelium virens TaxID=1048519 RepID=A0A6A6HHA3_VIRVR|nr:hypothetical protein EV356DRAFT_530059 [Viridothelium virens]
MSSRTTGGFVIAPTTSVSQVSLSLALNGIKYLTWMRQAADAMQTQSYDEAIGLYNNTWWKNVNGLTAIGTSPLFLYCTWTLQREFLTPPSPKYPTFRMKTNTEPGLTASTTTKAARLAVTESKVRKNFYVDWASKEWDVCHKVGVIEKKGLLRDGVDGSTCKGNNKTTPMFQQSVISGDLVELDRAPGNGSIVPPTQHIAGAVIASDTSHKQGILVGPGQKNKPDGATDIAQFKEFFMRNSHILQKAALKQT